MYREVLIPGGVALQQITCESRTGLTPSDVRESRLFTLYVTSLGNWRLLSFSVTWAVTVTRHKDTEHEYKDIILMFAEIEVRDENNRIHKSGALLRGETVEILPILVDPANFHYTVFVTQPRVPVGRKVKSTPAGMTDGKSGNVTVLQELQEELDRPVHWSEPIWLNKLVTGSSEPLFVSPGGSSETVSYCFVKTRVSFQELAAFRGHVAGNHEEGEHTETSIAPMDELPEKLSHYGVADNKTLTVILMYNHYHYLRGTLE